MGSVWRGAVGLALSLAVPISAEAAPAPLTGEVFSAHTLFSGPITGVCTTDPGTGTSYSLDFSGPAAGPYDGTFTERIRATVGPQTRILPMGAFPDGFQPGSPNSSQYVQAGQLLTLDSSFTIQSSAGDVSGTMALTALVPADSTHAGTCREWMNEPVSGFGTVTGALESVRVFSAQYKARISSAEGELRDSGTADLQAQQGQASNEGGLLFRVNDLGARFMSDLPPPPVLGRAVNVDEVRGNVRVAVSGARTAQTGLRFVPLREARQIPVGSHVDTEKGTVRLTSAADRGGRTQTGKFSGAVFQVDQSRKRRSQGVTELRLPPGDTDLCPPAASRAHAEPAPVGARHREHVLRRILSRARGRFAVQGRRARAAPARVSTRTRSAQTAWRVDDRCDGTLIVARRGRLRVRERGAGRDVVLRPGVAFLARGPLLL